MGLYDSRTYLEDLEKTISLTVSAEELKNKSILVTGATGTIGSFIVDTLLYYNYKEAARINIYAAGRSIENLKKRFEGIKTERLHYLEYDLNRKILFRDRFDYIIHAAGNAYPEAFNDDPVGTIMGNVAGTYRLLEYGKCHMAKRFLYVSSGEVYGQGDLALDSYEETYAGYIDSTSPRACYPNSKRVCETLCASFAKQYGLETIIVRPCHTYGPGMTKKDNRANAQFFKNALKGEDILLNSAGTQLRSYCYIADCISAILTVMLKGNCGEAYNIANPNARITIADFAKAVAEYAGKKRRFVEPAMVDIAHRTPIAKQVLSSEKLETCGWHGEYDIETGVSHTIKILQESAII